MYVFVYYAHVSFFKIDVIFYSAIMDGIIAALLLVFILFNVGFFNTFTFFDRALIVVVCLLSGYILAISIPTVIDRSLSFYILEKIHQRGGGIKLSSIPDIIKKEYVVEHRLADIRITEQENSGTIFIDNNCVKLTQFGLNIVEFSLFFRKNLLPRKRLIMNVYSDDLIDPFKNSIDNIDYQCN